jgi:hypothetical protein
MERVVFLKNPKSGGNRRLIILADASSGESVNPKNFAM